MLYKMTCTYCNHQWIHQLYTELYLKTMKCAKCDSKAHEIRYAKEESTRIDAYAGAPDFVEDMEPDSNYSPGGPSFDDYGLD